LHDSSGNLKNKFILTTIPIPTFCFSPFYSTHDSINIEPAELYYSGKVAGEGKLIVISQPEGGDICTVYELDEGILNHPCDGGSTGWTTFERREMERGGEAHLRV